MILNKVWEQVKYRVLLPNEVLEKLGFDDQQLHRERTSPSAGTLDITMPSLRKLLTLEEDSFLYSEFTAFLKSAGEEESFKIERHREPTSGETLEEYANRSQPSTREHAPGFLIKMLGITSSTSNVNETYQGKRDEKKLTVLKDGNDVPPFSGKKEKYV